MSTTKKCKLVKMNGNIYYLELMFIFEKINKLQKFMKKDILIEILFLKRKEIPDSKFIRINTSKEGYDANYEIGRKNQAKK